MWKDDNEAYLLHKPITFSSEPDLISLMGWPIVFHMQYACVQAYAFTIHQDWIAAADKKTHTHTHTQANRLLPLTSFPTWDVNLPKKLAADANKPATMA